MITLTIAITKSITKIKSKTKHVTKDWGQLYSTHIIFTSFSQFINGLKMTCSRL